jgi:uncharacterized membrane protein
MIVIGLIMVITGIIFSLQSKSMIGPSSSFMYDNPQWSINGSVIIVIGIIISAIGFFLLAYYLAESKKRSDDLRTD